MEAFLLAPNAPAQNVPQQANSTDTAASGEEAFAPLLNEAVARQQNAGAEKGKTTPQRETHHSEAVDTGSESAIPAAIAAGTDTPAATSGNLILSAKLSAQISLFVQAEQAGPLQQGVGQAAVSPLAIAPEPATTAQFSLSWSTEGTEKNMLLTPETQTPAATKPEAILIEQIQRLIDKGQEKGLVIIENSPQAGSNGITAEGENLQKLSSPLLETSVNGQIQAKQTDAGLLATENSVLKNNKTTSMDTPRQDSTGQYFKAKIDETLEKNDNQFQQFGSEQQGKKEQNQTNLQAGNTTVNPSLTPAAAGEIAAGNQFTLNSVLPEQAPVSVEGKFAPGASTPVSEEKLVDTLIQRFNVNPRLQTSKLTMHLHPAELGELKIDIQVKEDSIKANIVAQSQQIMDTLEKNMPRLRAVLQEQGFSIDALTITMDDKGERQHELFQEHFASQHQNNSSSTHSTENEEESFAVELENIKVAPPLKTEETDNSGLNVTV